MSRSGTHSLGVFTVGFCIALALLVASPTLGQSLGDQDYAPSAVVQVNEFTASDQIDPAVGLAADGSMVVVWSELGVIEGRRLDEHLAPVGGEFQVSWTTYGTSKPDICVDDDGNFVAAWQWDGFQDRIQFRRSVNGNFAPASSDDLANTTSIGLRTEPAVDCTSVSDFVIAWRGETADDQDAIVARSFAFGVAVQGSEFRVNTYTADPSAVPDVAVDALGDFVVVWGQSESDIDPPLPFAPKTLNPYLGVASRRFSSDGSALDVTQSTVFNGSSYVDSVGVDRNDPGEYVVVWEDGTGLSATASATQFSVQGIGLAEQSFVPSGAYSSGINPVGVFAGPDGAFVLATSDPDSGKFATQRYEDPLVPTGPEFGTDDGPTSRIGFDLAGRADGGFVMVWHGYDVNSATHEIYAQQWIPALFADSFESGDTMEWDEQVP